MYQSNEIYWDRSSRFRDRDDKAIARPSEVELTKQRKAAFAEELVVEQRDGIQYLAKSLIVLGLGIGVFLVHWILAKKARTAT